MTLLMCLRAIGVALAACLRYYLLVPRRGWFRLLAFSVGLDWVYIWAVVAVRVVLIVVACRVLWGEPSPRVYWTLIAVGFASGFLDPVLGAWLR